jgi:hypothetical protein
MSDYLFFPFSHISKEQLKTISAFFPKFGLLPLVQDFTSDPILAKLTEQGILEPHFPPIQSLVQAEKQVQSYLDWAQLNKGNEKNLKSLLKDQPYFFDGTGISSIQSQIRGGTGKVGESIKEGTLGREKSDKEKLVQDPLLFLKFAQLLDIQNEAVDEQLQALEQTRISLFSELKGEKGRVDFGKNVLGQNKLSQKDSDSYERGQRDTYPNDPGRFMTKERIISWIRYANEKDFVTGNGKFPVLVTTSPAVLDYLMSVSEYVINALDIDSIKVHEDGCENKHRWQQSLDKFIKEIIVRKSSSKKDLPCADDRCSQSGQIQLCLFSGESLGELFNMPGRQLAVCLVKVKS